MKPTVKFHSRGKDGNIFAILANAKRALEACGRGGEFREIQARVFRSESYLKAVNVIREKVDLFDEDRLV